MTIGKLLSSLFNLGAQTGPWSSGAAARDFWLVFAVGVAGAALYFGLRAIQRKRHHHGHPFGHTLGG